MLTTATTVATISTGGLESLLISFLVLVIVLAIIGGLLWCIEKWVSPIPPPVKVILAIVLLILIIIWAVRVFGGG